MKELKFTSILKQVYTDVVVGNKKYYEISRAQKAQVLKCCEAHDQWVNKGLISHAEYMDIVKPIIKK